jgi:hypothetical protein
VSEQSTALTYLMDGNVLIALAVRDHQSTASVAQALVAAIRGFAKSEFWRDDLSYADIDLGGVYGHRQVTDSYLVAITVARPHSRLATLDRALAARHRGQCHLLNTDG